MERGALGGKGRFFHADEIVQLFEDALHNDRISLAVALVEGTHEEADIISIELWFVPLRDAQQLALEQLLDTDRRGMVIQPPVIPVVLLSPTANGLFRDPEEFGTFLLGGLEIFDEPILRLLPRLVLSGCHISLFPRKSGRITR